MPPVDYDDDDVKDVKLLYLEMRYSDGETRKLEGPDAQRWFDAVNMRDLFCEMHGLSFPRIKWDVKKG